MSEWAKTRLGEMIAVNPTVKLTKGEIYPFIDIDKVEKQNKFVTNVETRLFDGQGGSRFQTGDTVFSRITPCLENRKIAQVKLHDDDTGFGSTEFLIFRNKKGKTDPAFVYYFISSDWVVLPAINSMTGASGRQRADRGFVERLKIKLPDIATQTRIADILSAYDDAIENNNRRIALLEKAARELYREWFVRFRFPGHEGVRFVNGLPEGWGVKKIGEVVRLQRGHDLPIASVEYGIYPVVGSSGVIANHKTPTTKPPVIVLGRSGSVGNPQYYNCDCWVHNTAIYAKEIYGEPLWVFYMLCQIDYLSLVGGSAVPTLNRNHVEARKILVPDRTLQVRFDSFVSKLFLEKSNLQQQSQNLARQRDLLLPRLMSGKLEVK